MKVRSRLVDNVTSNFRIRRLPGVSFQMRTSWEFAGAKGISRQESGNAGRQVSVWRCASACVLRLYRMLADFPFVI
jgi:hypothetical protein